MYGDFPAKDTVCTPYIPINNVWFWPALHTHDFFKGFMVVQPTSCVSVTVLNVALRSSCHPPMLHHWRRSSKADCMCVWIVCYVLCVLLCLMNYVERDFVCVCACACELCVTCGVCYCAWWITWSVILCVCVCVCDACCSARARSCIKTCVLLGLGLARTIYIRVFMYGNFGWEITKYTVIYGVRIRFWQTLLLISSAHCWQRVLRQKVWS